MALKGLIKISSVEYNPKIEGKAKFILQCCIHKVKNPVNIFVTTEANSLEAQVVYKNFENEIIPLCENKENIVDFKKVILFATKFFATIFFVLN